MTEWTAPADREQELVQEAAKPHAWASEEATASEEESAPWLAYVDAWNNHKQQQQQQQRKAETKPRPTSTDSKRNACHWPWAEEVEEADERWPAPWTRTTASRRRLCVWPAPKTPKTLKTTTRRKGDRWPCQDAESPRKRSASPLRIEPAGQGLLRRMEQVVMIRERSEEEVARSFRVSDRYASGSKHGKEPMPPTPVFTRRSTKHSRRHSLEGEPSHRYML